MPLSVEDHVANLRFRDNRVVFNESAGWLDRHRDESLPVMAQHLAKGGPPAIGIARVLGQLDDPRAVEPLAKALAGPDHLAYEAARALARTSGSQAADALRTAAVSADPGIAANALRGILLREDPDLCDAARRRTESPDPVGYHARKAVEGLGC